MCTLECNKGPVLQDLKDCFELQETMNRATTCPETIEMLHVIQMCSSERSLVLDIDPLCIFI